ncbi:MAG: hypothetical protein GY788_18585 [bacterium]|nr:hypothetical protein [bacterium]
MDFDDLTIDTASRHVGEMFTLAMNDGSNLELVLDGVAELPTGPAASTSFSLRFLGPVEPILEQGTYGLVSGDLEPQPVFIVPMANDNAATTYEAVFTRL